MEKTKLLFVCTANLNRSPSAEELFKNNKKYEAKSAGVNPLAIKVITSHAIKWADKIFVMEGFHKDYLMSNFPEAKQKDIIVLGIPDIYHKNDPELVSILKKKLKRFL